MSLSGHSELGDAPRYCQLLLPLHTDTNTHTHTHTVQTFQTVHSTGYASHMHTEKSQTLLWLHASGARSFELCFTYNSSVHMHAYTHTHFQGDLVTFPVCPILPPSMLSVSSPMPSRLELPLPQGQIRAPSYWASKKCLPALPAPVPCILPPSSQSSATSLHVNRL